jgi:protein-L-isoaspartate O-methyltransferase
LVIPVGDLRHQDLLLSLKKGDQVKTSVLDPCQFVPLIGKAGWPEKEWRLV